MPISTHYQHKYAIGDRVMIKSPAYFLTDHICKIIKQPDSGNAYYNIRTIEGKVFQVSKNEIIEA